MSFDLSYVSCNNFYYTRTENAQICQHRRKNHRYHAEQRSTLFRDLNVTERTVPVTEYYRKRAIPYRS